MKKLGDALGILILLMIIISFLTVLVHYLFNVISIPVQELIVYLHSAVFMLGIVYAYHHNKHVRIDIFYQNLGAKKQKQINQAGTILLLIPLFVFIFYVSFNYVLSSWSKLEGSPESGGLPFVYGLKTLILILPISMILLSIFKFFRKD
ncbi:MAG: TRAP transporter small permease subunit [Alcanivoracaceae bacterium]|nr:TRAP transporter small permease subunit [Alcanivoracaceae bacterium]